MEMLGTGGDLRSSSTLDTQYDGGFYLGIFSEKKNKQMTSRVAHVWHGKSNTRYTFLG